MPLSLIVAYEYRDEVEDFFKTMDRDFDQKLSFGEFLGEESHIEKIFKNMDKNKDGFVTKQEFNEVCQNLSKEQVCPSQRLTKEFFFLHLFRLK